MIQKLYDWKDVADSQLGKAVALSLVLLTFVMMVMPNIEVRKQKYTAVQTELVDLPPEEREQLEAPPTEIQIDVPIVISDELSSDKSDPALAAKYEQALSQLGSTRITTASSIAEKEEMKDFTPYDDPPVIIGELRVEYPDFAKRAKVQGTVMLEVEVYKDGTMGNVKVLKSITGLDQAAIDAVRKVKFQPGKSSGQPVNTIVTIPVTFKLN